MLLLLLVLHYYCFLFVAVAVFMMSYNGHMRVSVSMDKALGIDAKCVTDLIAKRVYQMIDASLREKSTTPSKLNTATSTC